MASMKPDQKNRIHKRAPLRAPSKANEIYVTRKSSFHGQLARARKMLVSDEARFEFIVIHGLGAAIGRAIELATVIQASFHDQVTLDVTTSTVTLIDDIIPEDPEEDLGVRERNNSAIHIYIRRKAPLASTVTAPIRKGQA